MVIDVGRPGQDVAVEFRQPRRRRLVPFEAGHAVREKGFAGEAFERRQLPLVAVQSVRLVALVQQEAQPRRRRLEHRGVEFGVSLEETRHQHHHHPQGRFGLEVLDVGQELVRQPCGRRGPRDEFRTRILCGIARRLERPEGGKRVHPIDDARFLHRLPHGFVLGLQRVIAHRVDGTNQAHPAAFVRHATDFLRGEHRVLHGQQRGEEEARGVFPAIAVRPFVVRLAHRLGPDRVLQPRIRVDVRRNYHHLVDALHVHVAQPGLGFVRALMVEIIGLFLRDRGLGMEVAHVQGALDVVLEPRPGQRQDVDDARGAADALRAQPGAGVAVDDELLGVLVEPHRSLECGQLVLRQPVRGLLPYPGRFGDVGVAVEGRKILGHGRELLGRHGGPPFRRGAGASLSARVLVSAVRSL